MSTTRHKLEFAYAMGKYSSASIGDIQRLMRLGATHVRLETEQTNGYKMHSTGCAKHRADFTCCVGEHDTNAAQASIHKMSRIDDKMEAIAKEIGVKIEYGALTVRVVFKDGREAGIP